MRPKAAAKYYKLQHSWIGRLMILVLALQCRTQIIREQESALGARHLLQARRPAEHNLLHCYVDFNSEAPGHYSFFSNTAKSFVRRQKQPQ